MMNDLITPLPQSMRDKLGANTHPGLLLDKYAASWDKHQLAGGFSERVQKETLQGVVALTSSVSSDGLDYAARLAQHRHVLERSKAVFLEAATTTPLTLHLARASALENAGICLHPLYGFVVLPGSGVKGMARAYAQTVWLPSQADEAAARRRIEQVFGRGPDEADEEAFPQQAGDVVFHDAWPAERAPLTVDIVNNHHHQYYGADERDNNHPPGDWDTPIMISFLAVPAKTKFLFAIGSRRAGVTAEEQQRFEQSRQLAAQWLAGALVHRGAGAKTSAGYGRFEIVASPAEKQQADVTWSKAIESKKLAELRTELELVTPAFLAGYDPVGPTAARDCDLRSATLRGLLRWWWRTLHSGDVDTATLRAMEAAVWGDTEAAGCVQLEVVPDVRIPPQKYDKSALQGEQRLPKPKREKTTQGLSYFSYGMDERKDGRQARRYFAPPGNRWTVRLTARPWRKSGDDKRPPVSAAKMLYQAAAALWLLCRYGGAGSKARRGFGSFAEPQELQQRGINLGRIAVEFRQAWQQGGGAFRSGSTGTAAIRWLEDPRFTARLETPWKNCWLALDRMANAAQTVAKQYKHDPAKKALGLPRNVRPPFKGRFKSEDPVKDRHASPVWFHLERGSDGKYVVRVTAFPVDRLPNQAESERFLAAYIGDFHRCMEEEIREHGSDGTAPAVFDGPRGLDDDERKLPPPVAAPHSGQKVQARLLEEKTKKGGWRAVHEPSRLEGPIQNTGDVPGDKQPGDEVTLIVASCNEANKTIAFRYPTDAELQRQEKRTQPRGGGNRDKGRRR